MNWIQRYSLPFFIVVVAAQWSVPISLIVGFNRVLDAGAAFRFKAEPRDPFNPFYGNHMIITYEAGTIDIPLTFEVNELDNVYVIVAEDENDFALITGISHEKPSTDSYFTARVIDLDPQYQTERHIQRTEPEENTIFKPDSIRVTLALPFTQFYLNQHTAPIAETLYHENLNGSTVVYGLVKIHKGKAILEMLYIGDDPITELSYDRIMEMTTRNGDLEE